MSKIQSRLMMIGILTLGSVWALMPRNVTQRVLDPATGG
jgi:hypothetical protein